MAAADIYIYVCMYVCMYVSYLCMYVCLSVWLSVYVSQNENIQICSTFKHLLLEFLVD